MAWTGYDEWLKKVKDSGMYYSDPDLQYAAQDQNFANASWQYKNDWMNAKTAEGRALANANMEKLRAQKGYAGGVAGKRYDPFGASNEIPFNGTTNNWAGAMTGAYNAMMSYPDFAHSDGYNKSLQNVLDYGPFEYDYTTVPLYSVYKKEYTREGQRAQQDALAQTAAMTGGVPSSYAQTAAQQAGNYYASQIADKIPELRAQAYNEYNQNFSNLLSKYNAAYQGDNFDYGVYSDKYDRLRDQFGLASGRYDTELSQADAAAAQLAALGDYSGYEGIYGGGYQAAYDAQQAHQQALEAAQLAAGLGNYSLLDQYYGLNGTLQAAYDAKNAPRYTGTYVAPPDTVGNEIGLPIPDNIWRQIGVEAASDPAKARTYLNQYWSGLSESQRNILARWGGIDPQELVKRGGATTIGQQQFTDYAKMLDAADAEAQNKIAAWVSGLKPGMTPAELDAEINSNPDLKNNSARNAAKALYTEMHGGDGDAPVDMDDFLEDLGAGLDEGTVREALKAQGLSETNGWKKYDAMYGYNTKDLSAYARLIASTYQNYGKNVNIILDMIDEGKANKRLSSNDLKFLTALLEGKADYIS